MLTICLLCIGKLKEDYLRQGCAEYQKRLRAFCQLRLIELPESKLPVNPSAAQISQCLEREGKQVLDKIPPQSFVVALCIEGEQCSSEGFAKVLEQAALSHGAVTLIIGGSYGLSDQVKQRADLRLSFSQMTFPHQLARVLLLEQLYRAGTIQAHMKYHK